ncbi:MFS transporter [Thermophagus sp. OGC60D27]|uniref:MFS transporter n=1 Tax=Thermophagus sp. OGC60D27 TaxID=3458415 RepID=UPI0040376747
MTHKDKSTGFKTLDVFLISLTHHIHDVYTSFLAPIQVLILEKLSINYTLFGLLSVIQRLPTLLNPLVGILADKVRIRYLMIVAPSLTAVSMSLIGLAPSYSFLVILMLVSGISSTMFHVPTPVMIRLIAGNRTGRGMSFYMVGGELARTLGPIVILGAIDLWGLEGTFRLIPAGILASLILFFRFRHVDLRKRIPHDGAQHNGYTATLKKYLPVLLIIGSITLSRGVMKSCLTYYLPGYLESTGSSRWMAGISLSVIFLSGTAGTLLSGTISDFIGRRNTLLIVSIVSPLLMGLFILAKGSFTLPLLIVMGFFLLAPTPVFLAIINSLKTDHLPFVNGLYMTSNFLFNSITTLATGYGFDHFGHQTTFIFAAFAALMAIPAALNINKIH